MKKSALIFAVACVLLGVAFGAAIKDGEEKVSDLWVFRVGPRI